jgi:hypothetical protein
LDFGYYLGWCYGSTSVHKLLKYLKGWESNEHNIIWSIPTTADNIIISVGILCSSIRICLPVTQHFINNFHWSWHFLYILNSVIHQICISQLLCVYVWVYLYYCTVTSCRNTGVRALLCVSNYHGKKIYN